MPFQIRIHKLSADSEPDTYEHMATARREASKLAASSRQSVAIEHSVDASETPDGYGGTVVIKASLKVVLIAESDGTFRAPPKAKMPGGVPCKARPGGTACFCQNCRAARR